MRIAVFICVLTFAVARLATAETIGQAKIHADGTSVTGLGSITQVEPSQCYIESTDRSSGIWVQADTTGLSIGDVVTASGTLASSTGEGFLQTATLTPNGEHIVLLPVALCNGGLGGLTQAGGASLKDLTPIGGSYSWRQTCGAPNTGVLTKIWGKVTATYYSPVSTAHWFYVNDCSGVVSDFGDQGVLVYSDADVTEGDCVTVTGISSTETALDGPSRLVRTLRPRSAADVQIVKHIPFTPTYPFSDEFDSPVLDQRWLWSGDISKLSLTAHPGQLTLYADSSLNAGFGPSLYQLPTGDWDLEMKVTPRFSMTTNQCMYVAMSDRIYDPPAVQNYDWLVTVAYNTTSGLGVYFGYTRQSIVTSDNYWLRLRMRSRTVYASVSADGITYPGETALPVTRRFLLFFALSTGAVYTPTVDYARFTRL